MDSDDDEIVITNVVDKPKRLEKEDQIDMGELAETCFGPLAMFEDFVVEIQWYNSCLVHAIINALQVPRRLDIMLQYIQDVAREEGCERTDILAGVIAARRMFNVAVTNSFDFEKDDMGILHVYGADKQHNHFLAMRRDCGVLFVLDSLDGFVAPIKNHEELFRRCHPYAIRPIVK